MKAFQGHLKGRHVLNRNQISDPIRYLYAILDVACWLNRRKGQRLDIKILLKCKNNLRTSLEESEGDRR